METLTHKANTMTEAVEMYQKIDMTIEESEDASPRASRMLNFNSQLDWLKKLLGLDGRGTRL